MKEAEKGNIRVIVVYRLDRISRNIGDFAGLIEKLAGMQIAFVSIREQFDTESPMGRAMMYIASVFSQLERETLAERVRDNMLELSKTGRWLGGTTPAGYFSEACEETGEDGRIHKAFRLKQAPEEAKQVRMLFQKYTETGSLSETETWMREQGYHTRNGKDYGRHAIRGILQNPVYAAADEEAIQYLEKQGVCLFTQRAQTDAKCGLIAYNRTIQKQGKTHEFREMQDWVVAVGKHEALVSGREWVKAQQLLERSRTGKRTGTGKQAALFSGLLICASCKGKMRKKLGRGFVEDQRRFQYLCVKKEQSRGGGCSMKNADGNKLDAMALEKLGTIEEDTGVICRKLLQYRKRMEGDMTDREKMQKRLQKQDEKKEKEILCLTELLGQDEEEAVREYLFRRITLLHEEREQLQKQLQKYQDEEKQEAISAEEKECICEKLLSFSEMLQAAASKVQCFVVQRLVSQAVWDGGTLHIYLSGFACEEVPPS